MTNVRWLLCLLVSAAYPWAACTTNTSLGREGEDSGRAAVDTGQKTRPETGCAYAPVSLDLSCNDDPNLPTVAGSCQPDGSCLCRSGFKLDPTSKRCKLDVTSDAGVVICTVGADQTCNDELWASWVAGTCEGGVACACKTGYLLNAATGKCKRAPITDAGSDAAAGQVCTPLLNQTCNDDDLFSGTAGVCGKEGACVCNSGFEINPASGRCRKSASVITPDASVSPDTSSDQKCYYKDLDSLTGLKRFRFSLTTPDGQAQSPHDWVDAGTWPINDFEGWLVEKKGNQLTIDSCPTPATCQASLYRFVLCDGSTCAAQSTPGSIDVPVPVGRRIRVVWHLESDSRFCPGIFWLAIYDAEPGAGQGNLLFLGSGGRRPEATQSSRNYMLDLPFSVAVEALACGFPGVAGAPGDFRFVFSPKSGGTGTTLKLATGENGTFEFAAAGGPTQRLQVHGLVAVQPEVTDHYWNWDFWMAAEATSTPVDAGSKDVSGAPDAKGVCTPGMNQTCNDDPISAAVFGVCRANGTCSCNSGYVLNPSSGRCARQASICTGSTTACGCGCCPGAKTPTPVCYYPSAGESISSIEAADKVASENPNCLAAGCSLGQDYLCCVEAAPEPAGSAQYSASFTIGAYDRLGLKKTGNDGNCMWFVLVSGESLVDTRPLRVSAPKGWGIEAITAGACSAGSTEQAIGAQGTVTRSSNGTSCIVSVHLTAFFYSKENGTITARRIDADDVPYGGAVSCY